MSWMHPDSAIIRPYEAFHPPAFSKPGHVQEEEEEGGCELTSACFNTQLTLQKNPSSCFSRSRLMSRFIQQLELFSLSVREIPYGWRLQPCWSYSIITIITTAMEGKHNGNQWGFEELYVTVGFLRRSTLTLGHKNGASSAKPHQQERRVWQTCVLLHAYLHIEGKVASVSLQALFMEITIH